MSLMESVKPVKEKFSLSLAKWTAVGWTTPQEQPTFDLPVVSKEDFKDLNLPVTTVEFPSPPQIPSAWFEPVGKKPVMSWDEFCLAQPVYRGDTERQTGGQPVLVRKFIAALEAEVALAGTDHHYTPRFDPMNGMTGKYIYDGKPDCLVGRVLIRMGVAPEDLRQMEGERASAVVIRLFPNGTEGRAQVARMAQYAQTINDTLMPWGMALSAISNRR